jgi:hypothetical protein
MDTPPTERDAALSAITQLLQGIRGQVIVSIRSKSGIFQRIKIPAAPPPFVPSIKQDKILDALKGKQLTGDVLADAIHVDRRTVYRRGYLPELIEAGLVVGEPRRGYYRPDQPPA